MSDGESVGRARSPSAGNPGTLPSAAADGQPSACLCRCEFGVERPSSVASESNKSARRSRAQSEDRLSTATPVIWPVVTSDTQRDDVRLDSDAERWATERARGECEKGALGIVDWSGELKPIQDQERFERGVTDPLVTVNEWMIADDRMGESGGLIGK